VASSVRPAASPPFADRAKASWRRALLWASAVFGVAALGLGAWPLYAAHTSAAALPPRVFLAGQEIPLGPDAEARALDVVRRYAKSQVAIRLTRGDVPEKRLFSRAAFGLAIDRARLALLVEAAERPTSALRRGLPPGARIDLPIPAVIGRDAALAVLLKLKDEVDRPPLDARFDLETKRLLPEQAGYFLDVFGTLAELDKAVSVGAPEVTAGSDKKPPRLVASQMGSVSFGEVLGWFETRYAIDKKHEARTFNLRLAASKLDGHVILPGETFDFNDVVGPRDEANGYKVAPVIAQGELVDGIGGGTCQIAGTLHGAAFFSGLDIVERRPHTRPSFYIKMGLDATVVYPTITLRLRNSFDHPVVLHETVRDGVVRAEILGPRRTRTVTFVRKIDEVLPFAEIERSDPKLPKGVKILAQRGIPGFRTHRYRVVREGAFAVRERWNDSYPPTNQIVRVGTAEGVSADGVEDDPHPEYVADDYLVLLQGPDVKGTVGSNGNGDKEVRDGGGMVELREAGRTGERGWTERAGFSHYASNRREKDDTERCTGDCPPDAEPLGAAAEHPEGWNTRRGVDTQKVARGASDRAERNARRSPERSQVRGRKAARARN
jgi:vancomycin resistance protein YoaR